ncbi:kinase-like domain-containing protein [Phyllosticta citricarpa]|uniref:Kinase-like domain-containing protein n=1 Tax=Phyllosticta paracitricarpa TaxID=2016321 RepID=A0ABR1N666_9PEZI
MEPETDVEMTDASVVDQNAYMGDAPVRPQHSRPARPSQIPSDVRNWPSFETIGADNAAGQKAYREDFNAMFSPGLPSQARSNPVRRGHRVDWNGYMRGAHAARLINHPGAQFTPINAGNRVIRDVSMRDANATISAYNHQGAKFTPINAGNRVTEDTSMRDPNALISTYNHQEVQSIAMDDADEPLEFVEDYFVEAQTPEEYNVHDSILEKYDMRNRELIGQGGEGTVYLTREHETNKVVALKYLVHKAYPTTRRPPNEIERLESIGLGPSSGRKHLNILTILEWFPPVGRDQTTCAYGMEFCTLDDLEKFTWAHFHTPQNEYKRPHEALLRSLYIDMLQGLEFLHSTTTAEGAPKPALIHGDIKPANVLLAANHDLPGHWAYALPTAKLADFGGATEIPVLETVADWSEWSQPGRAKKIRQVLTPSWAPPQAMPGDGSLRFDAYSLLERLRPSTDVYSVAATVGFVATGLSAREGGGYEPGNTDILYWDKARARGDKWWKRNVSLVARNDLLPPAARLPDGASARQRRRAWPSARAKNLTTHPYMWPEKEYSLLFEMALNRGFEPDVTKRANVRTLLTWLRRGFEGYLRELIHGEGDVGVET